LSAAQAPITVFQLESHLWESATILRWPVDAADFKTYIFPWSAYFQFEVTPVVNAEEGVPIQLRVNAWRDSVR
jgi:hypothetical protein